jgi:hypothetical protein
MKETENTQFTAQVATGEIDLQNSRFSEAARRQIIEQAAGQLITFNFDLTHVIGVVESASENDRGVQVSGKLNSKAYLDIHQPLFIVPSFTIKTVISEGGVTVYEDIQLMDFGLTTKPVDQHLSPVQIEGEKQ